MPQLHETRMGQKLIDGTLPRIADALEELVKELKRANDLKEQVPPTVGMTPAELADDLTDAERAAGIEGVAPAILRGGRTEVELSEAFMVVRSGADWRDPIDWEGYATDEQAELIRFAVRYYHGVEPGVIKVRKDRYRIESPGYRGGK